MTWKWALGSIKDINNNEVTFNYYKEAKSTTCKNEIAVYPDTITYANGHYRIRFERAGRTDYRLCLAGCQFQSSLWEVQP